MRKIRKQQMTVFSKHMEQMLPTIQMVIRRVNPNLGSFSRQTCSKGDGQPMNRSRAAGSGSGSSSEGPQEPDVAADGSETGQPH